VKTTPWIRALLTGALLASLGAWAAPEPRQDGPVLRLDPDLIRRQVATSREEVVDVNNQTTLASYLRAFRAAADLSDQDQIASEIADYCVERGLRPSPDVAEVFLSMALEAKESGNQEAYRRLARFAAGFAPDHPAAHLALADAARSQEGLFSGEFLFESLMAITSAARNPETRWVTLANFTMWLRFASLALLSVLTLIQLSKYQGLLRHDVREWLGGGDSKWIEVTGLVVLFLPSLLFLSGFWWIVYWSALVLLYARWSERVVGILAMALVVAAGALHLHALQRVYLGQSPPHVSNVRCYANRIQVGLDGYLGEHIAPTDPKSGTYGYLLACRYMLHGSYMKAENLFRGLLNENPSDARIFNNLGCLYYYQNRYQEAIQQFSRALESRPDMAVAYLNRALSKNKVFDFSGAEDDQAQARKLDPGLFRTANLSQSDEWSPIPAWMPLETSLDAAARAAAGHPDTPFASGNPGGIAPLLLRPAFSPWLVLLPVLFLSLALFKKRDFFARACFKCGQPFCSRCKTSLEFESFCSQCVHLYIKQDGVSPEARLKKNYEVENYQKHQRVKRVVLALVAPGTAHFTEGRPFSSSILLFLWFGALSSFFLKGFLIPLAFPVPVSTAPFRSLLFLFAGALLLILWGLFGIPSALRAPAPPQGWARTRE